MALWESVGDEYMEAVKSAFPLHRFLTAFVVFIGASAVRHQTHLSIFETITQMPLKNLGFEGEGLFATALIEDVLLGLFGAFLGWIFSRLILAKMFNWVAKLINFKIKAVFNPSVEKRTVADLKVTLELVESSLKGPKKRLHSLNALAEFMCGCALAGLFASWWGNALDLILGIALLLFVLLVHGFSIKVFLSDYLGPALYKASLLGRKVPSLDDLD